MAESKILVVDDDKVFLKLVENDLTKEGFAVITAQNGNDAIKLAKKESPALILLDISMPGISGGEVSSLLKEDPRTQDIPVIFLTALLSKEEEEKRKNRLSGHYFIAKPYNLKALLAEIRKFIPV
ncbi:MAG TPA: response regulator [Smithella sp.]|nr:response regulator [Smithella sp.]